MSASGLIHAPVRLEFSGGMKNPDASALLTQVRRRGQEGPLPNDHKFPAGLGMTCKVRKLASGSVSRRILYRAEKKYRPVRKDGERRLLSWLFAWTWAGYAEALDWKIGVEGELKTAKAIADKKGSRFYLPTLSELIDDCLDDPDVKAAKSLDDLTRHLEVLRKHCGMMLVNTVTHVELREVIKSELARGLSYESLRRLRSAISRLFSWALENDHVDSMPLMKKVKVPESAPRDLRERTLLEDHEFWQLVECVKVALRYRALYLASRLVGGMRASDLHALRWSSIDTEGWEWCDVTRPKTDGKGDEPKRLLLEPEAAAILKEYYLSQGRPDPRTHVFGTMRARRGGEASAGDRIGKHSSYAKRLRRHLKLAGIDRHELHHDVEADPDGTGGSKRADFHSFRRLYCTSLALAGVNIQTAMELAGHRRAETALRYVKLARKAMAAPAASKPKRAPDPAARAHGADTRDGQNNPADTPDTSSGAGAQNESAP